MKHDANLPQRDAALLEACRRGDTETALRLIAEGADIRAEDEERMTPMGYACQAGNEAIVEELLRRGVKPREYSGRWERPALYRATESGNLFLMKRLLCAGADPWGLDCEDDSMLSAAVRSRKPEVFDFLLDMGLYIEDESSFGCPFIYLSILNDDLPMIDYLRRNGESFQFRHFNSDIREACRHGRKEIVRRILQDGLTLEHLSRETGHEYYSWVLSSEPFDEEFAEMLYEAGVPLRARAGEDDILKRAGTNEARTWMMKHLSAPLPDFSDIPDAYDIYLAARNSDEELRKLMVHGHELQAEDDEGWTPLHYACRDNHLQAIKRLVKAGADVHDLTEGGDSCITLLNSQHAGEPLECLRFLLRSGCQPERIISDGRTALTQLIEKQQSILVMELLSLGADVSHRDDAGYTPYLAAARFGDASILARLEELGADPHALLPDGRTALHLAAQYEQEDVVRYLLSEGHEVNARDRRDYTPLLSCPSPAIAHLLLDAGADPLCRGKNGLTALMAVRHSEEEGIAKRLIQAGVDPDAVTIWGAKKPSKDWYC